MRIKYPADILAINQHAQPWDDKHQNLMREFFRRSALLAKEAKKRSLWPFWDVVSELGYEDKVDQQAIRDFYEPLVSLPFGPFARTTFDYLLKWNFCLELPPQVKCLNPFEPLEEIFLEGMGAFYQENRILFFPFGNLSFNSWEFDAYLQADAFI